MDELTAHRGRGETAFRLAHSTEGPIFDSDYARGKPPRGPQRRSALIQMGLSMWSTEEAARAKNDAFDRKLGDRLVVIELDGSRGIWWADTFGSEHMTV